MLLPQLLRSFTKDISIGYFHHIPFPSYELFRVLPERADLLNGLLGADLIGFHTHDYMRHFVSAAERVLDLRFKLDQVLLDNRIACVDAFPMGINYSLYHDAILNPDVQKKAIELKENYGTHKLILSVDRLDYSKGILHRLRGFALFLERHPFIETQRYGTHDPCYDSSCVSWRVFQGSAREPLCFPPVCRV